MRHKNKPSASTCQLTLAYQACTLSQMASTKAPTTHQPNRTQTIQERTRKESLVHNARWDIIPPFVLHGQKEKTTKEIKNQIRKDTNKVKHIT